MARPKGIPAWNKGLIGIYKASKETKLKMSKARKGKKRPPFTKEWRKNLSQAHLGRIITQETREKLSKALSGKKNYIYGKKRPLEWSKKGVTTRRIKGSYLKGSEHQDWKGDKVSYRNLHKWVERELGKPNRCEHCNKVGLVGKKIDWANKSGKYKRELTDWLRLCKKCHKEYDKK